MDEPVFHELVWEFFTSFEFSSVACRYDPDFKGIWFRLGGEPMKMSLLEFGWSFGLYFEEQSRLSSTKSGLRRGEIVKAEHVLMQFWAIIRDDEFVVGGMAVKKENEVFSLRDWHGLVGDYNQFKAL
ncbi:hypothetical protein Tco_1234421 [Tanacetum coccineum]